jgi:hypothetical protein
MATKAQVLELFDANPALTSYQIAEALGPDVMPEYVRSTLKRAGRQLRRRQGWHPPVTLPSPKPIGRRPK